MKNIKYTKNSSFLGKKLIDTSLEDKLNILLNKPSKLEKDDLIELKRIKALSRGGHKYYKEYINELYNIYYNN